MPDINSSSKQLSRLLRRERKDLPITHVTCLRVRILDDFPQLKIQRPGRDIFLLFLGFKHATLHELHNNAAINTLIKFVSQLF